LLIHIYWGYALAKVDQMFKVTRPHGSYCIHDHHRANRPGPYRRVKSWIKVKNPATPRTPFHHSIILWARPDTGGGTAISRAFAVSFRAYVPNLKSRWALATDGFCESARYRLTAPCQSANLRPFWLVSLPWGQCSGSHAVEILLKLPPDGKSGGTLSCLIGPLSEESSAANNSKGDDPEDEQLTLNR
jgi:hypothetical protein